MVALPDYRPGRGRATVRLGFASPPVCTRNRRKIRDRTRRPVKRGKNVKTALGLYLIAALFVARVQAGGLVQVGLPRRRVQAGLAAEP